MHGSINNPILFTVQGVEAILSEVRSISGDSHAKIQSQTNMAAKINKIQKTVEVKQTFLFFENSLNFPFVF